MLHSKRFHSKTKTTYILVLIIVYERNKKNIQFDVLLLESFRWFLTQDIDETAITSLIDGYNLET